MERKFDNEAVEYAREGIEHLLDQVIKEGADNYDEIAYAAALKGRINIINYLISHDYPIDTNKVAFGAAVGGYLDMIKMMAKRSNFDLNKVAVVAAGYGRFGVIEYFKSVIESWQSVADTAAYNGYLDIVLYINNFYGLNWNRIGYLGGVQGRVDILILALRNGMNNLDQTAVGAAQTGYLDIIDMLFSKAPKGTIRWNAVAYSAVRGDHLNIVLYAVRHGADDLQGIFDKAKQLHRDLLLDNLRRYLSRRQLQP
jgi:hypothetical protein